MPFNDVRSTLTDIIETIGTIRRFTMGIGMLEAAMLAELSLLDQPGP
jgi:hypothetical protein